MATTVAPPTLTFEKFMEATAEMRPHPELVDGEIVERAMPNFTHGRLQNRVGSLADAAGLVGTTEVHCRIGRNVRLPDVSIWAQVPSEEYPSTPPLATVEILSPGERVRRIMSKSAEYEQWGVAHIWLIDTEDPALLIYRDGRFLEVDALEIPEHNLRITLADLPWPEVKPQPHA
ncbi:MAG: Uma2 family endonuclease [Acidobacteria bacterium]|nr:Uma2 family endonuclease [Acidobacteriota bacterium]